MWLESNNLKYFVTLSDFTSKCFTYWSGLSNLKTASETDTENKLIRLRPISHALRN